MVQLSRAARLGVVKLSLAGMLIWPPVHHLLVDAYDMNPWKFFGFSMYCTPHAASVDFLDATTQPPRLIDPGSLPPALAEQVAEYAADRNDLGQLVHPRAIAERIMEARPQVKNLVVQVRVARLDAISKHVVERQRWYRFGSPLAVATFDVP